MRETMGDMAGDPAAAWEDFEASTDSADVYVSARTWEMPDFGALARAVRRTSLRRLFPFTSHSRFCLGDRADFWRTGSDGGHIAPAFIVRSREHGYVVEAGNPYHAAQVESVLTTKDPEAAAHCLEHLLADWPHANLPG
ncbi:hypothetical protein [Actinomadura sp. 9N407]|uniref:hypothetical protein n=1 Tax=Actinomadura sp. 9N407 TaxID=3375154 RepID=UPI0037A175BA